MKISIDRYVSLVKENPDNIGNGLYDLVLTEENFKNVESLISKLDTIQAWKLNLSEEVTNRIKEELISEVIEELKEENNITGYRTRELKETKVIMFKLLNNNSFQKEIDKKIVQTIMSNEKLTKEQKQESVETYLSNIEIKEQIQFLSENPKYLTNIQVKRKQ